MGFLTYGVIIKREYNKAKRNAATTGKINEKELDIGNAEISQKVWYILFWPAVVIIFIGRFIKYIIDKWTKLWQR